MFSSHFFYRIPVEHVVVGEPLPVEEVPDELPQVRVVWLLLEAEGAAVVEVCGEFG